MQATFDAKDFISKFSKNRSYFRQRSHIVRMYASNGKIEIASFHPRTKIELGAFIDASVPESGAVSLNFPAANFYDMCSMITKTLKDNRMVRCIMDAKDITLTITFGSSRYNVPVLAEKKSARK